MQLSALQFGLTSTKHRHKTTHTLKACYMIYSSLTLVCTGSSQQRQTQHVGKDWMLGEME